MELITHRPRRAHLYPPDVDENEFEEEEEYDSEVEEDDEYKDDSEGLDERKSLQGYRRRHQ